MKKFFILFFATVLLVFNSCSDDDELANKDYSLVGSWVIVEARPEGLVDALLCEQNSSITFFEDNTATSTFYLKENNCEPETKTGTWKDLGDGRYEIGIPFVETQVGTVEFSSTNEFTYFSPEGIQLVFQKSAAVE